MTLNLIRGDTETITVAVLQADATPMPLTGATIRFTAKRRGSDADADAAISKTSGSGIALGATGVATITLNPADTADLSPGSYLFDVEVTDSAGVRSTVAGGTLRLAPDISRA